MRGSDASLPLLWASLPLVFRPRARFSARSAWAHFKMPAEHLGLPGFSITACDVRRQIEEPPLMRFRFSLQHIPAAPYCPGLPFPDDPASAFCDAGTHACDRFALAVFKASRLRIRALIG